jgi:hypothetical protein
MVEDYIIDPDEFWREAYSYQEDRAADAIAVLGLIRGFDSVDLGLIAYVAWTGTTETRRAFEEKIQEETGISFTLTREQWGVMFKQITEDKS